MLQAGHRTRIPLVVVAEEMQQPVKRQNLQFCSFGMPDQSSLPPRDPAGNYDIPQETGTTAWRIRRRRKTQDVGRLVDPAMLAIEAPHRRIAHDGDVDDATGADRRDGLEPAAQAGGNRPTALVGNRHRKTPAPLRGGRGRYGRHGVAARPDRGMDQDWRDAASLPCRAGAGLEYFS